MVEKSLMLEEQRGAIGFQFNLVVRLVDSLKNKKEFDFVYKNSKRRYTKSFTLYVMKSDKKSFLYKNRDIASTFLLGLSISKKVGKATKRNLIKRRIRFICRRYLEELRDYSMIFVAKNSIVKLSFEELEQDFLSCLQGIFRFTNSTQSQTRSLRDKKIES